MDYEGDRIMGKTILLVDNNEPIHILFQKLFIDTEYTIQIAKSGNEALSLLEKSQIDLILSDIYLTEMNGYDLLTQVQKEYPKVFRVILSENKKDKLLLKAIQKNIAKLYIYKPWDNQNLLKVIRGIFEFMNSISSPELIKIINNHEGLPTLPSLYNHLCEAIHNDEDIDNIASIIKKDQAVAAQILHIANSAFFGIKTSSIAHAIINIGLNNIKNIVLATSVFNTNLPASRMKAFAQLWQHAYLCNQLTSLLYLRIFNKKVPVEYLSAGLLHDIGKIVLISIFGNDYYNILESDDFYNKEKEEIGITHQQIGGYFLDWWELPMPVVESVLYHHEPLNINVVNKDLIAIVHLADYYAQAEAKSTTILNEEVFTYLGIEKHIVEQYVNESGILSQ